MNYTISARGGDKNSSEELVQIMELDKMFFPTPWSNNSWNAVLESADRYLLFLLKEADSLIGLILFDMIVLDNCAHLLKIVLHPKYRSQGLAYKMLSEAIDFVLNFNLINRDKLKFYLEVDEQNITAISLYLKAGFVKIHTSRDFYGKNKNALIMMRMATNSFPTVE